MSSTKSTVSLFTAAMSEFEYSQDITVIGAMALLTTVVRSQARSWFDEHVSEWKNLRKTVQSRTAVEMGVIPTRILLIFFTLPIIWNGFEPLSSWRPADTDASILAAAILTGSYIIDLTVTRNDLGSTLHHCMGPALLVWIRLSFSTFTPADALLCRLLMSFIFFGGTLSGGTTTALLFLYHFRNSWFQSKASSMNKNAYFYFTLLLPVLAFASIAGVVYSTAYLHYWFDELVAYFGNWGYLPWAWVVLECHMQWRWLMWFYNFEVRLRDKFAETEGESRKIVETLSSSAWWLPSWRFTAIRFMRMIWAVAMAALVWRKGDIQYLARLASFKSIILVSNGLGAASEALGVLSKMVAESHGEL